MPNLSPDEIGLINYLFFKLGYFRAKNFAPEQYYTAAVRLRPLGTSQPRLISGIFPCVSWGAVAVDRLMERVRMTGILGDSELNISDILLDNNYIQEADKAHTDAGIFGTSYAVVTQGSPFRYEPPVVIRFESPNEVYGEYNKNTRKLSSAIRIRFDDDNITPLYAEVFLPEKTLTLQVSTGLPISIGLSNNYNANSNEINYAVVAENIHNYGFVPVFAFQNNSRSSKNGGTSEITRVVRSLIDSAIRTFGDIEVLREFYTMPQKWITGANPESFQDADGNATKNIKAYADLMLILSPVMNPETGATSNPQIGQFTASSPDALIKQIALYRQELSAATSIPVTKLGSEAISPPSAEAQASLNEDLIKKAEDRMSEFGTSHVKVIQAALAIRDGYIDPLAKSISVSWKNPSYITQAALADSTMKLIAAGVLTPDSMITYRRLGFTDGEIMELQDIADLSTGGALVDDIDILPDALTAETPAVTDPAILMKLATQKPVA